MSNAGPLIHLAKAGLLELIRLYDTVIPREVKVEVVDRGRERGFADALLVEQAVEAGWLRVVEVKLGRRFAEAAEVAGLQRAEIMVVYYAYQRGVVALLDDEAARLFARGLGVRVRGSLGLLVEGVKRGLLSYSEGVRGLDRLSEVMYLSSNVYRLILRTIEHFR